MKRSVGGDCYRTDDIQTSIKSLLIMTANGAMAIAPYGYIQTLNCKKEST